MIEPQLAARSLIFSADVASNLVARADREKTAQVLLNLLSNASKFTPPGGQVRIQSAPEGGDAQRVVVRVSDTELVFPATSSPMSASPSCKYRRRKHHGRKGQAWGLRSAVISCAAWGDLTVESEEGRGSTFTLTLPQAPG